LLKKADRKSFSFYQLSSSLSLCFCQGVSENVDGIDFRFDGSDAYIGPAADELRGGEFLLGGAQLFVFRHRTALFNLDEIFDSVSNF
jgi:hypothetical protein